MSESGEAAPGGIEIAPGIRVPETVLRVAFSRSGGPGGQNVNKVSTKCELRIDAAAIPVTHGAQRRLARLAGRRLTEGGELVLVCESERSQSRNREECLTKLRELLVEAMVEPKKRRATKPTRGSRERRLEGKRIRSEHKKRRGRDGMD